MKKIAFAALPVALAAAPAARAQDQAVPAVDPQADSITIGVGAAYLPSYEGSDDYSVTPAALIRGRISNFAFFSRGTNLFIDALPDSSENGWDMEFGPVANLRRDRSSGIKDARVMALGKIGEAFELGAWAGIAKTGVLTSAYDNLSFRVSYLADLGDSHKSYTITPAIEYGTPLSTTAYAGISVSADYVGKGYGRTYYGISPAGAAASGLPAYTLSGSGFKSLRVGALAMKSLTGDLTGGLSIGGGVVYARMLGKYRDSPIVSVAGDPDQWIAAAGLAYTF